MFLVDCDLRCIPERISWVFYRRNCRHCFCDSVSPHLTNFLHEDFLWTTATSISASTKRGRGSRTAEKRRISAEHKKIQEDGFEHCLDTVGITCMLLALHNLCYYNNGKRLEWKTEDPFAIYNNSSLLKLVSKPIVLCVED